jgi:hypothetical protein
MLAGCEMVLFDGNAAVLARKMDAPLRLRGTLIDLNDIVIAAIAIGEQVPLVTGNIAHFETIRHAAYARDRELAGLTFVLRYRSTLRWRWWREILAICGMF